MKNLLFILIAIVSFFSCKKNEYPKPEPLKPLAVDTSGFLEIHIDNVMGNVPLLLGSAHTYTTSSNDTFSVNLLKYYVSNVQLTTNSGFTYKESESYYLIDAANPNSLHLMVKKVPNAQYNSISFLIGVDSTRNTSGAQLGALDPSHGMFWSWKTGYIMAMMEGHSAQSSEPTKKIVYHIGGYAGKFNGVRLVTLSFPNTANVTHKHTPILNLKADINTWLSGINPISIVSDYAITGINAQSEMVANNYATMFSVTSVVN